MTGRREWAPRAARGDAPATVPGRQSCRQSGCFASFGTDRAQLEEVRGCNRGGPDGGHSHRWDGSSWQLLGAMEHDRP